MVNHLLLTGSALLWAFLVVCFDGLALSGLLLLAYQVGTPLGFSGSLFWWIGTLWASPACLPDRHSSGLLWQSVLMDWHFLGFSCLLTRSALLWASLAVCFDGLALSGLLLLAYQIGTLLGFSGSLFLMDWHSLGFSCLLTGSALLWASLVVFFWWIGTLLGFSCLLTGLALL